MMKLKIFITDFVILKEGIGNNMLILFLICIVVFGLKASVLAYFWHQLDP